MGWLAFVALAAIAYGTLRWLRVAGALASFVAAALMLGAAGYAWQGNPGYAGRPTRADAQPQPVEPGLVAFRQAILGDGDQATFSQADAALGRGDVDAAARTFLISLATNPRDAALWTGLGSVLAAHDGGQVSPAALFAFRRAVQLAPGTPGPPFFLGLAQVQAGDFAKALPAWQLALATTPRNAEYRTDIVVRLAMVRQALAQPQLMN